MSDVPLAKTTLKTAKALPVQPQPRTLVRAKPLGESEPPRATPLVAAQPLVEESANGAAISQSVVDTPLAKAGSTKGGSGLNLDTVLASFSDTAVRKRANSENAITINVDAAPKPTVGRLAAWLAARGSSGFVVCILQLIVHEAPAWTVSMVVHMATLVTMALITVQQPTLYKPQHLLVTPPEEEKIEEIKDASTDQPTTLDENQTAQSVAFDSNVEQEQVDIQPSEESEAAPAAVDVTDFGLEHVPKSDLLQMVGAFGGNGLSGRSMAARAKLLMQDGGSESSEKAVGTALKWLAAHQMPDGGWNYNHTACPACRGQCRNAGTMAEARNAATAMALLPFLGRGDTHKEGAYRNTVRNGLSFLINHMHVGPQGGAMNEPGGRMYAHGLASIVLCEAYGMTHDKQLLVPAQSAMNYISFAQDPGGGGWRYMPHEKGDTSMVGWQLMALKSGLMANLNVQPLTIRRACNYLDSVQKDEGAAYGYTDPTNGSEATAAIGLLCRMYLGWKKDNPALQRGVRALSNRGPSGANMYYNYYATQVMRHWEGEEWINWNRQMRDQLVHAQAKQGHEEGSWFTGSGDTGAGAGGRLYCTAMATMILEVYYRHLPIYGAQSVEQDFPD